MALKSLSTSPVCNSEERKKPSPAQEECVAMGTHYILYHFNRLRPSSIILIGYSFTRVPHTWRIPMHASFLRSLYKETKNTLACPTRTTILVQPGGPTMQRSGESVSSYYVPGTISRASHASPHLALQKLSQVATVVLSTSQTGGPQKAQKGEASCLRSNHR